MALVASVFRRFVPQLLHVIVLPIFFFTFMLIYRPLGIEGLLGKEWFGVHLTIISCIVMLSAATARSVYYFIPMRINYALYVFWCLGETIFISFFVALYIWLVMGKALPYFEYLAFSFKYISMSLIYPYAILGLSIRAYVYHERSLNQGTVSAQKMRFYDHLHHLKIVLDPSTVLYISAEENYVNIYYSEGGRVREFNLRSSMKAIDELCQDNGLVRCHRSFYINPVHVKVLRRDKDGIMYAELDSDDVRHIPVSKTYYGRLSDII